MAVPEAEIDGVGINMASTVSRQTVSSSYTCKPYHYIASLITL